MASLPSVPRVKLGSQELEVSAHGLECMGVSQFYGPPGPEKAMIELIHHAMEKGITFLDTADIYGPHTNEILLGKESSQIEERKLFLLTCCGLCLVSPPWLHPVCNNDFSSLTRGYGWGVFVGNRGIRDKVQPATKFAWVPTDGMEDITYLSMCNPLLKLA